MHRIPPTRFPHLLSPLLSNQIRRLLAPSTISIRQTSSLFSYDRTNPTNPTNPANPTPSAPFSQSPHHDSDSEIVKSAEELFHRVWTDLTHKYTGGPVFPKEIIWLGGAPGSGKSTHTAFIMKKRGFTADPIMMSDLLTGPELQKLKAKGLLINDLTVINLLFEKLLDPSLQTGVVVDGFPRTPIQVECVKLLYQHMQELHNNHGPPFQRPVFRVAVLYIEEPDSIERQLQRGREIAEHNKKVREQGHGRLKEERTTDVDEDAARTRYLVFHAQTYNSLMALKNQFPFHIINSQGPTSQTQQNILREFQYQSSNELDEETYSVIRRIPLASESLRHVRQQLISRLESYQRLNPELFEEVTKLIESTFIPIIKRNAISGQTRFYTEERLFLEHPVALDMVIDVLSERGFFASFEERRIYVPDSVDLSSGKIINKCQAVFRFFIAYSRPQIR